LLLVDDHPVVRAGLNSMLRKQSGLKIVGSLHGGREALDFLANEAADVMLLDLRMPNMDGIDTLRALRKMVSPPKVVILSNFEFDEEIYRAVEAGAMAYLGKDTSRDEIITAIKAVHAGKTHFPKRIEERQEDRSSATASVRAKWKSWSCYPRGSPIRPSAKPSGSASSQFVTM
jgi:DNA-binding NarL/FixJ family response regulator